MAKESRSELRRRLRATRRRVSAARQRDAAEAAARRLRTSPIWVGARRIAAYWPEDGELETWPILQDVVDAGKQLFLPCLDPLGSKHLAFRPLQAGASLPVNRFGIPEPAVHLPRAALWTLDLVLVPLVAFDDRGHRLGMGGGYYDKTLGRLRGRGGRRPALVGLAHAWQEVPAIEAHAGDVALDWILTPKGWVQGIGPR